MPVTTCAVVAASTAALTGSNKDADEDATAVDVEEATPRDAREGEDGDGSRRRVDVDGDDDDVDASDARANAAGRARWRARARASSADARRSAASARRRATCRARESALCGRGDEDARRRRDARGINLRAAITMVRGDVDMTAFERFCPRGRRNLNPNASKMSRSSRARTPERGLRTVGVQAFVLKIESLSFRPQTHGAIEFITAGEIEQRRGKGLGIVDFDVDASVRGRFLVALGERFRKRRDAHVLRLRDLQVVRQDTTPWTRAPGVKIVQNVHQELIRERVVFALDENVDVARRGLTAAKRPDAVRPDFIFHECVRSLANSGGDIRHLFSRDSLLEFLIVLEADLLRRRYLARRLRLRKSRWI